MHCLDSLPSPFLAFCFLQLLSTYSGSARPEYNRRIKDFGILMGDHAQDSRTIRELRTLVRRICKVLAPELALELIRQERSWDAVVVANALKRLANHRELQLGKKGHLHFQPFL